jgi:flagellar hook-associated protein FlgK
MNTVYEKQLTWEVTTYLNDKFTPASITRLDDNQTFSINDYVTNGTQMRGYITRFELSDDLKNLWVYTDWSEVGMNLESIYKIDSRKLPSKFQHGDSVIVEFDSKQRLYGKITKVSFTFAKVLYDVEVKIFVPNAEIETSDDESKDTFYTRIHSIDSAFVHPATEEA